MTDPTADTSAIEAAEHIWSCSHCGPHRRSGPMWCAVGCGSDYNAMTECVVMSLADNARLTAAYDAEVDLAAELDCQIARLTAALAEAERERDFHCKMASRFCGELGDATEELQRLRLGAALWAPAAMAELQAEKDKQEADAATGRAVGRALAEIGTVETSAEGARVWFGGDPEYVSLTSAEAAYLASLDEEEGT